MWKVIKRFNSHPQARFSGRNFSQMATNRRFVSLWRKTRSKMSPFPTRSMLRWFLLTKTDTIYRVPTTAALGAPSPYYGEGDRGWGFFLGVLGDLAVQMLLFWCLGGWNAIPFWQQHVRFWQSVAPLMVLVAALPYQLREDWHKCTRKNCCGTATATEVVTSARASI
jgi:hypothetical protein